MPHDTDPLAATWAALHDLSGTTLGETLRAPPAEALVTSPLPHITLGAGASPDVAADLELVRVLGAGGMGEVLLARQRSLGRDVAVKRARAEGGEALRAALVHEARMMGRLEHPNIVPVHALGVGADDVPVMLMKRIEGTSLAALLRDPEHQAWAPLLRRHGERLAVAVAVLEGVCDALELSHARGVVHRDVKPDNVMIGTYGEVYLLDWGVAVEPARAGERVELVGTPGYLAPEMVVGHVAALGPHTDVYLLGATLHEVLTGRPRHDASSLRGALESAIESAPFTYDDAVPRELAELCNETTAREPGLRPAGAAAFRQRLVDYTRHGTSRALAAAAWASLAAAEASTEDGASRGPALTECRFGFVQALRAWPDNVEAARGLSRTLRHMLELELERESPDAARSLHRELAEHEGAPDRELAERIEAARAALEETRERARRVGQLQREMDPGASTGARKLPFLLLFLASLGVGGAMLVTDDASAAFSVRKLVLVDAVVVSVFFAALAFVWRRLAINTMSRRITWLVVLQTAFLPSSDLLALARGATFADAMTFRLLVLSAGFACAAALSLPALGWLAGLCAASAFALALTPAALAPGLGLLAMLLVLALSIHLFASGKIKPRPEDTLSKTEL